MKTLQASSPSLKVTQAVVRRPWVTMMLLLVVTGIFAAFAVRVQIDVDPWIFLPDDHQLVQDFEWTRETFDTREMVVIAIEQEGGIFNPAALQSVIDITAAIEEIDLSKKYRGDHLNSIARQLGPDGLACLAAAWQEDGWKERKLEELHQLAVTAWGASHPNVKAISQVKASLDPIEEVISFHTVEDITGDNDAIFVNALMPEVPDSGAELLAFREKVLGDRLLTGGMVAENGEGCMVLIRTTFPGNLTDIGIALYEAVRRIVQAHQQPGQQVYVAGSPAMAANMNGLIQSDLSSLLPVVILIVIAVLCISFRTFLGVLLPLSVVLVSVVWTLGMMGMFSIPMSMVMTVMPVLLIAIGSADGIHILTDYYEIRRSVPNSGEAVFKTMKELNTPVIFTSVTSAIGFGSLATSDLVPICHFGVATAFGIMAAMVFSLTFIPAFLSLVDGGARKEFRNGEDGGEHLETGLLGRAATLITQKSGWILAGCIPLRIGVALLASQVEIREDYLNNFKKTTQIWKDARAINQLSAGAESLYCVFDTGRENGAYDPEVLQGIEAFQRDAENMVHVGKSFSIVDYIKRLNRVFNNDDPRYERVPAVNEPMTVTLEDGTEQIEYVSGAQQIAQYLLLYETGGGDNLANMLDAAHRRINVVVQSKSFDSIELKHVLDTVEQLAKKYLPGLPVVFSGIVRIDVAVSRYVVEGQARSLMVSYLLVFVVLCIVYRSLELGFFATLPLILAIGMNFAIMTLFSIPLNIGTTLVGSASLGIGIDYSIHILSRYKTNYGLYENRAAMQRGFKAAAKGIVINAISVAAGFIVLMRSSFLPLEHFGLLVAATMLVSATCCLITLPALVSASPFRRSSVSTT